MSQNVWGMLLFWSRSRRISVVVVGLQVLQQHDSGNFKNFE